MQVEYIQVALATRIEDGPLTNRLRWILDPARSGQALVMSAIGCHAQHLACFVTGQPVARVTADVGALVPGRTVVDHVSALLHFEGGAHGTFTVTQAAAGGENDIRLRVYGEKGLIDWSHREPSYLKLALQGEPVRTIGRGDAYLPPDIIARGAHAARPPRGPARGLRQHLCRDRAGAHGARTRRSPRTTAVPAHRGRRAHDGVHRGVPRVAGQRPLGRGGEGAAIASVQRRLHLPRVAFTCRRAR